METLTLTEVRNLLDHMAEWRLLTPLGDGAEASYERLCELEERLIHTEETVTA